MKKQSPSAYRKKKPVPEDTNVISTGTRPVPAQNTVNIVDANKASAASEIITTDYKNMPGEVKARISANKASGKYLLDGIEKNFVVEIKKCLTETEKEKTLSFLKTKKWFIHSALVSAGVVKITVDPTFNAAELKEALLGADIRFNFLNRSYSLKN